LYSQIIFSQIAIMGWEEAVGEYLQTCSSEVAALTPEEFYTGTGKAAELYATVGKYVTPTALEENAILAQYAVEYCKHILRHRTLDPATRWKMELMVLIKALPEDEVPDNMWDAECRMTTLLQNPQIAADWDAMTAKRLAPSNSQIAKLRKLGYTGPIPTTSHEASSIIMNAILTQKFGKDRATEMAQSLHIFRTG
jgi:hypothetical protein